MRLLLVELSRLRSRRAVVLMLLAAFLLTAFLAGSRIYETRPVSAADRASAQAQADAEAQQPGYQRDVARCEKRPQRYLGRQGVAADCEEMLLPQAEWYLYRTDLSVAAERQNTGLAVAFLAVAVTLVAGATFAGADWSSGSMSNQLLFEPRRSRVWLAKAGAVALAAFLVTAVVLSLFWLTLYLAAASRGIPTGATVQVDLRWTIARTALLAALAALGSYALTMLLRHTVGTLAMVFGYAVVGQAVVAAIPVEGTGRWALGNNVIAWIRDGTRYYDPSLVCRPGSGKCVQYGRLSFEQGAVYLGATVLVVVLLSLLLFRRRDIP